MDANSTNAVVAWLSRVEAYPHRPANVQHIETHISHVFLAGPLVFKLKKPARFDFLDYSTLAQREQACRDELRLNRRLAASSYLQVLPVTRLDDLHFEFDGPGQIVDWVVQMRRLPTEHALDALIRRAEVTPEHIALLSQVLVRFYRSQEPLSLEPLAYSDRVRAHVAANARELSAATHHLSAELVDRVHHFQLQTLTCHHELFNRRVVEQRLCEGHGDLRPEHICFADDGSVIIFDCIEFSEDLRRVDCLDELAFLAAECDFLGAQWIGPQLRKAYEVGCDDSVTDRLWSFYKSYRAAVRAKIAALRAEQLCDEFERQTAIGEAVRHLSLADEYGRPWLAPLAIVVGGLSGTGKSTLARAIAERLGARLLRTDSLRQQMFGDGQTPPFQENALYGQEARESVYTRLIEQAAGDLQAGISVVLDGTFGLSTAIQHVQTLTTRWGYRVAGIECTCPSHVARARIAYRLAKGNDPSQARPETHDLQQSQWQPWPPSLAQLRIDTQEPVSLQLGQALRWICGNTKDSQ